MPAENFGIKAVPGKISRKTPKASGGIEGVGKMKLDTRLVGGILVGLVLGLHYQAALVTFLPIFTVAALIVGFQLIRR